MVAVPSNQATHLAAKGPGQNAVVAVLVGGLLAALPLKEDHDEDGPCYDALVALLVARHPAVASRLPKVRAALVYRRVRVTNAAARCRQARRCAGCARQPQTCASVCGRR